MTEQDLLEAYLRERLDDADSVAGFDRWLNETGEAESSGLTEEQYQQMVKLAQTPDGWDSV